MNFLFAFQKKQKFSEETFSLLGFVQFCYLLGLVIKGGATNTTTTIVPLVDWAHECRIINLN